MRVLDAFHPWRATWSGQVISSSPGPSQGPSKTHLLPGGRVPRVHRARSPVPPRLPLFVTPRSVRPFAAVAAGAYPPRRPPNAWSPGAPALPGPCYWLVASGTPLGWRGGCLALMLVRGALRHYCLGRCSALVVCARRSRPVRGGWGRCRACVFPVSPCPPRVSCAVCGGSSCLGVPYPRSLVRHSMRSVRSEGSVRLPFRFSPRVLCVCVRSRSRGIRTPPPPWVGVARAPRAVLVQGAGRAVPLGPCPSACPTLVPCSVWLAWGEAARSRFPLPGLGLRAPRGVGAGVGTRHEPHRAHSCELASRAGSARCRGGTRAPEGGASCLGAGRPGSGALPPPTTRPFRRAAGAHYPLAVGAGGAGAEIGHQFHSARSCELALRAVGAA